MDDFTMNYSLRLTRSCFDIGRDENQQTSNLRRSLSKDAFYSVHVDRSLFPLNYNIRSSDSSANDCVTCVVNLRHAHKKKGTGLNRLVRKVSSLYVSSVSGNSEPESGYFSTSTLNRNESVSYMSNGSTSNFLRNSVSRSKIFSRFDLPIPRKSVSTSLLKRQDNFFKNKPFTPAKPTFRCYCCQVNSNYRALSNGSIDSFI